MRFSLKAKKPTWSLRQRLRELQRERDSRRDDVRRLQEERERLELRHAMLAAVAEMAGLKREWAGDDAAGQGSAGPAAAATPCDPPPGTSTSSGGSSKTTGSSSGARDGRSEQETRLLRELEQLPLPARRRGDGDDDEPAIYASPDDPLCLHQLRRMQALPRLSGVTLAHVQELHGAAVREMALQLQLLEAGGGGWQSGAAGSSEAVLALVRARLSATVTTHALQLTTMFDDLHIFMDLQLTNAVTGERLPEPDVEMHRRILAQLRLSPKQLRRIRIGAEVLRELHDSLLDEQRAAQAECAALAAADAAATVAVDGTDAAAGAHLGLLQKQEASSVRLGQLLQREKPFLFMPALLIIGSLTPMQLAKVFVFFWPFYPVWKLLLSVASELPFGASEEALLLEQEEDEQEDEDEDEGAG